MSNLRFFDSLVRGIDQGEIENSCMQLLGALNACRQQDDLYAHMRTDLRAHELHRMLLEDPFSHRAWAKPRGYAGDAELIDLLYDRQAPKGTSQLGASLLQVTSRVSSSAAVCHRRDFAAEKLEAACGAGKRICVLACGHLREADGLVGKNLSNIVAVDLDLGSLEHVGRRHGSAIELIGDNALNFLRATARAGRQFDYIYTLGLTDYFDEREVLFLHRLMKSCLAADGEIMVANFVPDHLALGWMDAVMDWNLVYRSEVDMERYARSIGLDTRTSRDPTDTIVFSEMSSSVFRELPRPTSHFPSIPE